MTACILDASVALTWLIDDEIDAICDSLIDRVADEGAVAPAIWPTEVANGLLFAARRGRIPANRINGMFETLIALDIQIESTPLPRIQNRIFALATMRGLTVYDASYLELALNLSLPLATVDQKLRQAAEALDVPVLPVRSI